MVHFNRSQELSSTRKVVWIIRYQEALKRTLGSFLLSLRVRPSLHEPLAGGGKGCAGFCTAAIRSAVLEKRDIRLSGEGRPDCNSVAFFKPTVEEVHEPAPGSTDQGKSM